MNVYVTPNNLDMFVVENIDRIEESIIVLAESDDGRGEITITADPEMPFEIRCDIDGKSVTEITENPAEVYGKFFESLKEYDSLEIKPEPEEEIEKPEESEAETKEKTDTKEPEKTDMVAVQPKETDSVAANVSNNFEETETAKLKVQAI